MFVRLNSESREEKENVEIYICRYASVWRLCPASASETFTAKCLRKLSCRLGGSGVQPLWFFWFSRPRSSHFGQLLNERTYVAGSGGATDVSHC